MKDKTLIYVIIIAVIFLTINNDLMDAKYAKIETELPMISRNIGFSLNGGLIITAPNIPGHWETEYGFFSDRKEIKFCPIYKIGIEKFTFIPDNSNIPASSVYSVIFVWKYFIEELLLALIILIIISFIIKISPSIKNENTTI